MATLKVQGVRDRNQESELARGALAGKVHVKDAALVQRARAGAAEVSFEGLAPDDVVELELQDGLRVWMRVDDATRDLAGRARRGQAGDVVEIPSELVIDPASRSVGGWAIKAMKVLGIDIEEKILDFVADKVEGQLQPGPGLYRCSEAAADGLQPVRSLDGDGPTLVFLHGTASSTSGSFGGLWNPDGGRLISRLFDTYRGRVLAFQHRTLTESPIANALALVEALRGILPANAEVHLVSHSRGGMIGELLARGQRRGAAPFTRDDLDLFADRTGDRDQLKALAASLERARLNIGKFVRVACPARGTTLADRRLDRYVSVLVNLGSLIPGFRANPVYDGLTSLLAGVLKKRTEPEELPGIEAMMPTSPLVRVLNRPDVVSNADLHVLGGDLAGVGLFGRLKTLATDLYYRDDHDLVVNTPAMLGGVERSAAIKYWIDTGDQVTHFNYFARPDTARKLVAALTGADNEYRTLEVPPSAVTSADYVKRAALSQPVVFVVPGFMGSELTAGGQRVWIDVPELSRGGLSRLTADAADVSATGLLADGYAALCKHLSQTHAVVPFAYDWRLSIEASARALRDAIEKVLPAAESANQPVRLLAHGSGGLVVRAMLAQPAGAQTWSRMSRHSSARFIMLGTPNGGTHHAIAMASGRDPLVQKLALVDLRRNAEPAAAILSSWEGLLDLLPQDEQRDWFSRASWNALLQDGAAGPSAGNLSKARKRVTALRTAALDPARTVYVAGKAGQTLAAVAPSAKGETAAALTATARGDGRVTWDSGIPSDIRTYYAEVDHGALTTDPRHFAALIDLLETGTTSKLQTRPPASRGAADTFAMRSVMPAMVPDAAELAADARGGSRERRDAGRPASKIKVSLRHDNLTNARWPVLASHYRHDVIVGAEGFLDARLDGRLSELLRMELYPGPLNTGVVVLNDWSREDQTVHPGAIIAGLGMVGELTPGALASTLANALTLYGADCVGRERRRRQRQPGSVDLGGVVSAAFTAILVGSGEGGVTLADSVRALLRAIVQANQRLGSGDQAPVDPSRLTARIDQVDILELYEDRAIEALHKLRAFSQSPEFAGFEIQESLVRGVGGRRRVRFDSEPGWWQRIRITGDETGELSFEAVTQTARAPARLRPTQRGLVDRFVEQALASTARNLPIGQTLFELLVPHDFKGYAPDRRKVALMLNASAAAIPWELMHDGFDRAAEPMSVAGGMIRQLLLADERAEILRAPSNTALVVGNPAVEDRRFPPLPGAADEAVAVGTLLSEKSYDVTSLLEQGADPLSVLAAVHERPWRVLHLAAHGVFEFEPAPGAPKVSGLVLGDGIYFTAAEANQLRYVPELVFINCCHLGQTRGDAAPQPAFHRLAANLATQFIAIGARAVVAAGWEVDDAAAKTFATSFYHHMLEGELYGDAVLQARSDTYRMHGDTNTWGAYQCYGDPSFSLSHGRQQWRDDGFVSEAELGVWLDDIAAKAREAVTRDREQALLAQLEEREKQVPAGWWESADLCARAAAAFLELGRFESAIRYYDLVSAATVANAPIKALEQLASCRIRWAGALGRQAPPQTRKALAQLKQAEQALVYLTGLGKTAERWSLRGSLEKRRVLLTTNAAASRAAVARMRDAYERAYEKSVEYKRPDPYPLGNRIAAEIVLDWTRKAGGRKSGSTVPALLKLLDEVNDAVATTRTDGFGALAAVDRNLLESLFARKVDARAREAIVSGYAFALARGATARMRETVRTHMAFLVQVVRLHLPPADRSRLEADLRSLIDELKINED